ncbi:MAG: ABC transporter substrate-binding protein, partial [Pseudonocardia sp.]|nr:ABC transporter substrate-binding protein [Pseudonocardia sp.]
APEQLRGRIVATPQAGNSQDVALRTWLKDNSLAIGDGPGEVIVANIDNARTLDLYRSGEISGGWLPEPWTSRMVAAGATVLVDEASLWPGGRFPTTVLVVRTEYLQRHPETIEALLRGEQRAIEVTRTDPADAKAVTNEAIRRLTGSALAPAVLDRAFDKLAFSNDPLAATFPQLARHSVTAGALPTMVDLRGFVDLTVLNRVRRAAGQPAAAAAGLDNQGRDR